MSTHTGTVKFYRRQQAYGFIRVDGGRDDGDSSVPAEVFVHRNSINAKDDAEGNVYYPFLREGERVAFDVENVEGQQRPVAKDLTFADGSIVPTVRPGVSLLTEYAYIIGFWTYVKCVNIASTLLSCTMVISQIIGTGSTFIACSMRLDIERASRAGSGSSF